MKKVILKKNDVYRGSLILVNSQNRIKDSISKANLASFSIEYKNIKLEREAYINLQKALKAIEAKKKIVPVSGYRSLEEQTSIYNNSMKENGKEFTNKYVASPGTSEHQTGLAIDLGLNKKEIDFIRPSFPQTGICKKFRDVSIKYGFILRYTEEKKSITKISDEEWHFRYVGYPHSEIMSKKNFCLEEYISYLKKYPYKEKYLEYNNYKISYLKMDEEEKEISLCDNYTISGDNTLGFIITEKEII